MLNILHTPHTQQLTMLQHTPRITQQHLTTRLPDIQHLLLLPLPDHENCEHEAVFHHQLTAAQRTLLPPPTTARVLLIALLTAVPLITAFLTGLHLLLPYQQLHLWY
jgi:hypothetical protein